MASTMIQAQNSAGSVYSIFGIGEMSRTYSSASQAMGYASIGLSSPYHVNIINPAANNQTGYYFNHVFDVGFYYANTTYQSQGEVEKGSYGGLSNFSFWFKYNDKWNGLIGLASYSNVGYNINKSNVNSFETGDYDISYNGSGGLNELYFSNGYTLVGNLSLGLKLSFIFGNILHTENVLGQQSLKQYQSENKTTIINFDAEYSLNYKWQREKYFWNFGLIYKNPTNLKGNALSSILEWDYTQGTDVSADTLYSEQESASHYVLPRRIGFGMSYNSEKVILAGDVEFNQWSSAEIDGYTDDLRDTWKFAFGMELTPDRFGQQAFGRMSYRLGGYFENSYLKVNGRGFNTYGITAGLSIPLRKGSAMNLAYQRQYNGTTENDLILESTHEISVNFSIRQRWFQRPKYD